MVWEEVPDDGSPSFDSSFTSKVEPLRRTETDSSTKENKVNQIEEKKASTTDKPAAKPLQASSKGATGKKTDAKPTGGQQKNMMSFFAKK